MRERKEYPFFMFFHSLAAGISRSARQDPVFETIEEAQDQATEWLWTYNNKCPNMGIGGMKPAMKLAAWILRLSPINNEGITESSMRG